MIGKFKGKFYKIMKLKLFSFNNLKFSIFNFFYF